jgi:hypothetical protein
MCQVCGDPRCGTVALMKQAAAPVTTAVAALKAVGYSAVGVTDTAAVVTGDPTMAHDAYTAREVLEGREAAKARLKAAHEAQHGVAKANDNLTLPGDDEGGDADQKGVKAADKAVKGPKD